MLAQPIVFFGSEGELGVVARDFADYAWLLAGGVGPMEAAQGYTDRAPIPHFEEFAARHAPGQRESAADVIARAKAEHPDLDERICALCK